MAEGDNGPRPLEGVRVVEMGSLLAGPFCGQLLADFGAEVIKVEPPGKGDPMRVWGRHRKEGRTLWWPIIARNKKSVTLNLREEEGQELARRLISGADVVVENFRPGTLERWGLGYEDLSQDQPRPRHGAGLGVRADGAVQGSGGVRVHRRGHGWDKARHGVPRPSAAAGGDQPRRLARRDLRGSGRGDGPLQPRGERRQGPGGGRGHLRGRPRAHGEHHPRVRAHRAPQGTHRGHPALRGPVEHLSHQRRRLHRDRRQRRHRFRKVRQGRGTSGVGRERAVRHPPRPRREPGRARRHDLRVDGTTNRRRGARGHERGWASPPGSCSPRRTCSPTSSTPPGRTSSRSKTPT